MSEKTEGTPAATAGVSGNESTEHINLKVVGQNGEEVFFKIKRTTPLKKLMEAYASRQNINKNSIKFLYDGQRINDDQTPADFGMEDQDSIDAMLTQLGGFY